MKNLKIIIAGGSGFMGQSLIKQFGKQNEITVLSRGAASKNNSYIKDQDASAKYVSWDAKQEGEWTRELEDADLLINLTGKSVNCRYTKANKAAIINSRMDSTTVLGAAMKQCKNPLSLWINLASATIYPHATKHPFTEKSKERQNDFSVQVCQKWEVAFNEIVLPNTRKIILRSAIVLGKDGGVMTPYSRLAKFGLGGRQGSGHQMFSWIHEVDIANIISWLWENTQAEGVYNASSPGVVDNSAFMKNLRHAMKVPFGLPAPEWMLKLGAAIIGTEPELLLKSRWVLPERLLKEGFHFEFPKLQKAFENLI